MEGENPLPDLPSACSGVLPFPRPRIWPGEDSHAHPFWEWAFWRNREYPRLSGPLYPNTPNVLFCAFPRPASPTSNTFPAGCPSPTWVESIELTMSAATEVLRLDQLDIHTQR